jgi:hypothetical protein
MSPQPPKGGEEDVRMCGYADVRMSEFVFFEYYFVAALKFYLFRNSTNSGSNN